MIDFLLVLVSFSWAAGFIMMKTAVLDASVWHVLWIRFALATIIMLPFRGRQEVSNPRVLKIGLLLGILLFGSFALIISGLQRTTASNTGFLTGLSVVWVPALMRIAFNQRISRRSVAGAALCVTGTFILAGGNFDGFNSGDWLVIAGSLLIAAHVVAIDRWARNQSPVGLTIIQLATVCVLSIGASSASGSIFPTQIPVEFWAPVAGTAVLSTAFAFWVQTKYQSRTTAVRAAVIFSFEPVLAAALAWLYLNEHLTAVAMFGGTLVVAGMLLTTTESTSAPA